nr:uncharacterized protein LOC113706450 [Coffea arabica]XP_027084162.1 uncharacterized protein LOC113706450 [Coffea arabica]
MQILKKVHLLQALLLLNISFPTSVSQETTISNCGKIRIQSPFFLHNSTYLSPLNHMLLCKAQKLYFRTSLGLFQVSSIDYETKLLTISHSSCSSASHFISPTSLSAGFPHPPQPNSLVLYNCLSQKNSASPYMSNCTSLPALGGSCSKLRQQELRKGISSCFVVQDVRKLDGDFHPKQMNCTHYRRMYRNASVDDNSYGFELGTRISFDVHVPNPCDECKKPDGNCGVGLRCICHARECKDKVVSVGVVLNPFGSVLFSFVCFVIMMDLFNSP